MSGSARRPDDSFFHTHQWALFDTKEAYGSNPNTTEPRLCPEGRRWARLPYRISRAHSAYGLPPETPTPTQNFFRTQVGCDRSAFVCPSCRPLMGQHITGSAPIKACGD